MTVVVTVTVSGPEAEVTGITVKGADDWLGAAVAKAEDEFPKLPSDCVWLGAAPDGSDEAAVDVRKSKLLVDVDAVTGSAEDVANEFPGA